MPPKIEIVGRAFGRLVVVAESAERKGGRRQVVCKCSCGTEVVTDPRGLLSGHAKSCGCLQKEKVAEVCRLRSSHGDTGSKEYVTWIHMRGRCSNPSNKKFEDYGGRGIRVCDKWESSYEAFLSDMGRAPSPKHTIERDDVNGNYEPGNCRWATPLEQARNKRHHRIVDLDGRMMPLSEACEITGINYRGALYRLKVGKNWLPAPPALQKEGK